MADPTIKQAYVALYQNRMSALRKGDSSFRYDLEAVGVKQGSKNGAGGAARGKNKGSPSHHRNKTNDHIRKLDTRIFAEQVVDSFPKEHHQIS